MSVHTAAASCALRPLSTLALHVAAPAARHSQDTLVGGAIPSAAPTPLERTAPRRRRLGLRLPARRSTRRSRSPRCGDAPGVRGIIIIGSIPAASDRRLTPALPFPPIDPLGGAAVHWRQRSPFRSHTRDRQSSYNPQPCSACAPRTAVRRSLGSRSSTPAAIVPAV